MIFKKLNYIISIIFCLIIFSKSNEECQLSNYCGSNIACSDNGNCNFDIFAYYKENYTPEDRSPHCECKIGYTSYDIEHLNTDSTVHCCYEQKRHIPAFFLELFIGFGSGHFYLRNIKIGLIKFCLQIFFCFLFWCMVINACNREYYEDISDNSDNLVKNENKLNEIIDEDENENNDSKTNENKSQKFEYDINKNSGVEMTNFQRCPKSMIVIYMAGILYIIYHIVDVIFLSCGVYKDKNGEKLLLWR